MELHVQDVAMVMILKMESVKFQTAYKAAMENVKFAKKDLTIGQEVVFNPPKS